MRGYEIFCVFIYIAAIIQCVNYTNLTLLMEASDHGAGESQCTWDPEMQIQWAGNSDKWFVLETAVFVFYLATNILLMAKSRCKSVGINQQTQF